MNDALKELAYLRQTETYRNGYGAEISSHPELGSIAYTERCAEFVETYGDVLLEQLTTEQDKLKQALLKAWEYRFGGWENIVKTALIELGMEDEL